MEEAEKQTLDGFLKWAAELGITDSPHPPSPDSHPPNSCLGYSLAVSHFPQSGGRGLGAVRDIRRGELVLKVPKSALLTRESLLKDKTLASALSNCSSLLSPTQMLAVCLLFEMGKGKSSSWYPYLVHIPRSYDLLATFSEFEKNALQVDDAIWTTEKATSKAKSEWREVTALMKDLNLKPQLLTFRAWVWASATISSRTMHLPWDGAGCLCPVGDLFNYAAPEEESNDLDDVESETHTPLEGISLSNGEGAHILDGEQMDAHSQRLTDGCFDEAVGAYCFYARRSYKMGEQVLLSYGTYTNLELLEHYGFVLDGNPNDKVFIPLEPDMYCLDSWPKDSMYIGQDGKPSFALLSALRLWAASPKQRKSLGYLAYSGSKLSVENEISILKWISKSCHTILDDLPTTVEEDALLLSTIDNIQIDHEALEWKEELRAFEGELCAFLECNSLREGKHGAEFLISEKTRRSLERWRLAVQWRFSYKKILVDCISYCNEIINSSSSQVF
ncbi:hypothetical protein Tsubulata_010821 [Turnera subulata]|uniref:SET domain-containing protein n=1 Tax=Turnera subulata TaxID=218843 RepID=A0A9Q0FC60_9ROSI|nr:hypothetical protein Tsubulata_010821 [Turnera subulata]